MQILILLVLFGMAYLIIVLPRQRELKRHQALMGQLAVGDDVMMGSGVYGTIRQIDGDFVHLEVTPGVELKIAKRAVAAKVEESTPEVVDLTLTDAERDGGSDGADGDSAHGSSTGEE
jgi:preprotein translocase subunit YajC